MRKDWHWASVTYSASQSFHAPVFQGRRWTVSRTRYSSWDDFAHPVRPSLRSLHFASLYLLAWWMTLCTFSGLCFMGWLHCRLPRAPGLAIVVKGLRSEGCGWRFNGSEDVHRQFLLTVELIAHAVRLSCRFLGFGKFRLTRSVCDCGISPKSVQNVWCGDSGEQFVTRCEAFAEGPTVGLASLFLLAWCIVLCGFRRWWRQMCLCYEALLYISRFCKFLFIGLACYFCDWCWTTLDRRGIQKQCFSRYSASFLMNCWPDDKLHSSYCYRETSTSIDRPACKQSTSRARISVWGCKNALRLELRAAETFQILQHGPINQ